MNKPEPQARLIIQNYSDEFSFLCHVLPEYEERLKELAEPYCSSVRSDFGGVVAIAVRRNYNPSAVTDYLLAMISSQ